MTRICRFLSIAPIALAAPLASQTQSADAPATVVILAHTLSLVNQEGFDFGSHFATAGVIKSGQGNTASWSGSTEVGAKISIVFTALPKELARVEGGPDVVPISYGTTSASAFAGAAGGAIRFNPEGGLSSFEVTPNATFVVALGSPGNAGDSDLVSVDLTGKPAGTYKATITLTVTVL